MGVDWSGYESYAPSTTGPLHEVPRREARVEFNRVMAAKADRIEALRGLLARNGVVLRGDDEGLLTLYDWFRAEVRPDPELPGRMAIDWYPVVHDVGLFLGDTMIERAPNLTWYFFTHGKKNISYHRWVILGFTKIPNPRYNVDPCRLVTTCGHRFVSGLGKEDDFFGVAVRSAVEEA